MSTRRQFIGGLTAGAVSAITQPAFAVAQNALKAGKGSRIRSAIPHDETILRNPKMTGDNWHMTWADDDRQYSSMCDGFGELERPPGMYNSRLVAVEGTPEKIRFRDIPTYPDRFTSSSGDPRYYNFGVIAVDGGIYQFLSTWSVPMVAEAKGLRFIGVKAIYSPDTGRTWFNQDGSSPVLWEDWNNRSRDKTMLFLDEPQETFSMLSVLQMGRNYSQNRDGYVYMYSPNGNAEGSMNELVMLRVPKSRILDRKAYEYFSGFNVNRAATWSNNIDERAAVHTFARGWVNRTLHPWAWIPSITYNAPLGVYMMANWATGAGREGAWFQRPSYLGFWTAHNPWGPWAQIYENTSWTPGGDADARCYSPIIAPKWVAADGKSFWLVWTDFQQRLSREEQRRRYKEMQMLNDAGRSQALAAMFRINMPYYSFNVQRIDLEVN